MRTKKIIVLAAVFIVSATVYHFSRQQVNIIRSDYAYRLQVSATPIPPEIMLSLAGEFKGIMSDYLLLEAASFIGGDVKATPEQWNAVAYLLEQSSILDPYFQNTYILTQGTLPWQDRKLEETLVILERSKNHRHWDWQPGYFKGFDQFYFLKDNLSASKELMEASQRPDAPILLAILGSRLATKVGQTQSAMVFLEAMLVNTKDEHIRKTLEERLVALKGVLVLQGGIDRFYQKFGRIPNTLEELVDKSILFFLPLNPYNRPYSYIDGELGF